MKYTVCSYPLQDGRYGAAFIKPPSVDGQSATFSEPFEFGQYFPTKDEADAYVLQFLKEKGVEEKDIETK